MELSGKTIGRSRVFHNIMCRWAKHYNKRRTSAEEKRLRRELFAVRQEHAAQLQNIQSDLDQARAELANVRELLEKAEISSRVQQHAVDEMALAVSVMHQRWVTAGALLQQKVGTDDSGKPEPVL